MSGAENSDCSFQRQGDDEELESGPPASKKGLYEVDSDGNTPDCLETGKSNVEDASGESGVLDSVEVQEEEGHSDKNMSDHNQMDIVEHQDSEGTVVQILSQELGAEAQTKSQRLVDRHSEHAAVNESTQGYEADNSMEQEEHEEDSCMEKEEKEEDNCIEKEQTETDNSMEKETSASAEDHQKLKSDEDTNTGNNDLIRLALAASFMGDRETSSTCSERLDVSYSSSVDYRPTETWGEQLRDELLQIFSTYGLNEGSEGTLLEDMWANYLRDDLEPLGWIVQFPDGKRGIVTDINWKDFVAHVKHPIVEYNETFASSDDGDEDSDSSDVELVYSTVPVMEYLFPLERVKVNARQPKGRSFLPFQAEAKLKTYSWFAKLLLWPGDTPYAKQWFTENLDPRLKMWDDMIEGNIPEDLALDFLSIVSAFKKNHEDLKKLCKDTKDTSGDLGGMDHSKDQFILLGLQEERLEKQMKYFVDPTVRQFAYRTRLTEPYGVLSNDCYEEKIILISRDGAFSMQLLNAFIRKISPNSPSNVRIVKSLAAALMSCPPAAKIYLPEGTHYMAGLCNLESGGSLIGLGGPEKTILEPRGGGDTWLMVHGLVEMINLKFKLQIPKPCTFEGLTIGKRWSYPKTCIQVLETGRLFLRSVVLEGPGFQQFSETTTGVLAIHQNSFTEMEHVSILNFSVGISTFGHGTIEASLIRDCSTGIRAIQNHNKQMFVDYCSIDACEFGMKYKCEVDEDELGDHTLLEQFSYPMEGTTFKNCRVKVVLEATPILEEPIEQEPLSGSSEEDVESLPEEDNQGDGSSFDSNLEDSVVQNPKVAAIKSQIPFPLLTPPPEENQSE